MFVYFFSLRVLVCGSKANSVMQPTFLCLGNSSDDEKQEVKCECPAPSKRTPTKNTGPVAKPIVYAFIWCLVMFTIIG